MAPFAFATAGRIVFGRGSTAALGAHVRALGGSKALLVTGKSIGRAAAAVAALEEEGIPYFTVHVDREVRGNEGIVASARRFAALNTRWCRVLRVVVGVCVCVQPTTDMCKEACESASKESVDVVVGFGGGACRRPDSRGYLAHCV